MARVPAHLGRSTAVLLTAILALCLAAAIGAGEARAEVAPPTSWTFMVYLDGDNNLDPWGQYTLDLMADGLAASGAGEVVVPVLYDHAGAGGAEYGVVTAAGYHKLADVPEPDMGSPDTLTSFIVWATDMFPAERYVLDMWDHGQGWVYLCTDSTTREGVAGDSAAGRLLISQLGDGIAAAEARTGEWIDLVVFEACNMGMEEVAYQLRDLTDVVVGTEVTQDFEGIPWQTTLRDLDQDPGMSAADLGALMVDDLMVNYTTDNRHAKAIATLSSISCDGQAAVAAAADELAVALMRDLKHWQGAVSSSAAAAKDQLWCSGVNGINWYADLGKFARAVSARIDDPAVDAAAAKVRTAIADSVYVRHGKNLNGKIYGVTVSFPPNRSAYDMKNWLGWDYANLGLDFTEDTAWDEMLRAYYVASGRL